MNKVMSLLTVTVRSSFYKICLILLAMCMLQLGLFYRTYTVYDYSEINTPNIIVGTELPGQAFGVEWSLESLVEKSKVSIVFLTAFAVITVILYWAESERKDSHTFYFYNRLMVNKKKRITSLALYNFACIIVFLFMEMLVVFGMGMIFEYLAPTEYQSVQMYFMAFYKSEFLHCLFPMAEIYKWIRNIILFAAIALDIAVCACGKRKSRSIFLLIAMVVLGFVQEIGTYGGMDIVMILVSGICIGVDVYQTWGGGAENGS